MVRNYLPARSNLFAIQRFKHHCLSHKFNGKLKKNTGGERNNKYLSLQHFYLFLLQSSNIKIILPHKTLTKARLISLPYIIFYNINSLSRGTPNDNFLLIHFKHFLGYPEYF